MKKILCCILTAMLFFNVMAVCANATETNTKTMFFSDGSYATIELFMREIRASGSKTGTKVYTYYNSDSISQWKAVLTGSFTYTGSNATCISSSMDVTIYDSSWYTISKFATKSENIATGSASIGEKVGGVTVMRIPVDLTLTCDSNGNLR